MKPLIRKPVVRSLRAVLLASALAAASVAAPLPSFAAVPLDGYADLVAKVSPAVVFIEVTSRREGPSVAGPESMPHPLDEFMRRFGGQPPVPGQPPAPDGGVTRGLGSGFLLSADGEIVTNHHVVEGATSIKVRLEDGREFTAKVVGADPLTDVALLKLEDASDLPAVTFAQSEPLRVGDAVVAVGNPFGLGGTVTSGIVSAMGRNLNAGPYDSYIQTDAAINRGNSGGPLFNAAGEVVGMNTAIFSPTGGSVGIGFAVPAGTIQNVIGQLRDNGTVARGWLGVQIQPVTADLAQALGLPGTEGAMVAGVLPGGPAEAARLQSGDIVMSVNGQPVDSTNSLPMLIAALAAGSNAELGFLRDGTPQVVSVTIGTLTPDKLQKASLSTGPLDTPLGVTVEALTPEVAAGLGLQPGDSGVVIRVVAEGSPNAERLLPGDVIVEAAGVPVASPEALTAALEGRKAEGTVLLKLNRAGSPLFVGATLAAS